MEKEGIKIQVSRKGPYIVTGTFTLIGADGWETIGDGMIALCRCGGSNNKPYCDGTHTNIGFNG